MVTNILCHKYYITEMYSYHITSFRVFTESTRMISHQWEKSHISVRRFNTSYWLEITIHMVCFYYYYKITHHVIILDGVIIASYDYKLRRPNEYLYERGLQERGVKSPPLVSLDPLITSLRCAQLRPNT